MPWSVLPSIHVDGQHLSAAQEIADGSKEEGAAPPIRACLDDQLRLHLMQNFLVRPEIERALEDMMTEPECVPPRLLAAARSTACGTGQSVGTCPQNSSPCFPCCPA